MTDQYTQPQVDEKPVAEQKTSGYMVLQAGGDGSWTEVGVAEGVNALAAVKAIAPREGRFVSIPMRSWKPRTRKPEVIEKDVWS